MLRILFAFLALPVIFTGAAQAKPPKDVMMQVFNDGKQVVMQEQDLAETHRLLFGALKGARPMPALGVSLHDDTLAATEQGLWMRFAFEGQHQIDGLPFDQLLINIAKEMSGVTIIRGNEGKFDGRCFYLDLEGNLNGLYDYLISLPVGDQTFTAQPEDYENNFSSCLICKAISKGIMPKGKGHKRLFDGRKNASALQLPAVNKDKENQNTVINQTHALPTFAEQSAIESKKPPKQSENDKKPIADQITFNQNRV